MSKYVWGDLSLSALLLECQTIYMTEQPAINVVYQGIPGSYSEASLRQFARQHNMRVNPVEERGFFEKLFKTIINTTGWGWVPVSNSHAGTVHQAIDMFVTYDVEIVAEYYFDVRHCLATIPGTTLNEITTASSHPQALAQCSTYLMEQGIATLISHDTAQAAEMVARQGNREQAAICSEQAANLYGLDIIARDIQNSEDNVTRFLLVKEREATSDFIPSPSEETAYKTTIIFSAQEEAGHLYHCISGFAEVGINMSKLESRRTTHPSYDYLFYLDYDCQLEDPASQRALSVLRQHADLVRVLGSYPKFKKE